MVIDILDDFGFEEDELFLEVETEDGEIEIIPLGTEIEIDSKN